MELWKKFVSNVKKRKIRKTFTNTQVWVMDTWVSVNYVLKMKQKKITSKSRGKKEYDRYRHRYSIVRIFNHRYNSLKDRCTKVHKVNGIKKSVYGKKYLTKKRWLKWCYEDKNYKKFMNLYNTWVQSGFNRKLVPSIDRINNKLGYEEQNIQWLTLTENCSKHDK